MIGLDVYELEPSARWADALAHVSHHDFYHLAQYHVLAEQRREGRPYLYVYREADCTLALPLLLRPIVDSAGAGQAWMAATSVYGYAGPVASHATIPQEIVKVFPRVPRSYTDRPRDGNWACMR